MRGRRLSAPGSFETAPAPAANATIRFALSGDADATPGPNGKPGFNDFQVYGRMAAEQNDFNVNLGDTIYSDSELSGSKPALTVADKWQKYKYGLALPNLRKLRAGAGPLQPLGRPRVHQRLLPAGVRGGALPGRASRRSPTTRPSPTRRETGSTAPSAGARTSSSSSSTSARSGARRRRRAAPATSRAHPISRRPRRPPVRAAFATLIPPLAQPVPQACTDAIDSPARTFLGARQHAAFVKAIRASTRDLEGRRQRDADPAVLPTALRPLGGLRGRAHPAPARPRRRRRTSSSSPPTRTRT